MHLQVWSSPRFLCVHIYFHTNIATKQMATNTKHFKEENAFAYIILLVVFVILYWQMTVLTMNASFWQYLWTFYSDRWPCSFPNANMESVRLLIGVKAEPGNDTRHPANKILIMIDSTMFIAFFSSNCNWFGNDKCSFRYRKLYFHLHMSRLIKKWSS
jgi:hypothetical protein